MRTKAECSIIRMENWMAIGITLQGNTERRVTWHWSCDPLSMGNPGNHIHDRPFPLLAPCNSSKALFKKRAINRRLFKPIKSIPRIFYWETWQWASNVWLDLLLLPIFSHFLPRSSFSLGSCCPGNTPLEFHLSTPAVGETHTHSPLQGGF